MMLGDFGGSPLRPFGRWTLAFGVLCPVCVLGWLALVAAGAWTAYSQLNQQEGPLPFSALWAHLALAGLGALTVLSAAAAVVSFEGRQQRRLRAAEPSADRALPARLLNWRIRDTGERLVITDRPGPLYHLVPVAFGWTLMTVPVAVVLVAGRALGLVESTSNDYPLAVVLWVATSAAMMLFMAMRRPERLCVDKAERSVRVELRRGRQAEQLDLRFGDVDGVSMARRKDRRRVLRLELAAGHTVELLDVAPEREPVLQVVCDRVLALMGREPEAVTSRRLTP